MGKILAVLAAGMVAAGGTTYAFFHYSDPYRSDCCPLTRAVTCCTVDTAETCPASADQAESAMAVAGPVAMFTSPVSTEASCCSAKPATRAAVAPCCAAAAACCATTEACCAPGLAAVVGPAAAR